MKTTSALALGLIWLLVIPVDLAAQDTRLAARLDSAAVRAIDAAIDSAQRIGLPTEPLVQRALEGASKGADGPRIVEAVRRLAQRLTVAQRSLGPGSSESELVAGADALFVGVRPATLSELRAARRGSSVTVPLVVLADLVQRGAARDTVAGLMLELAQAGVRDANLSELRRLVERDIRAGAAPTTSAAIRAEGILLSQPVSDPPKERDRE